MKNLDMTFVAVLILAVLLVALSAIGRSVVADTGHDGAVRKEVGSYIETRSITVSSTSATELTDGASIKRPEESCRNNGSYIIYVGSAAAGTTLSEIGYPVKAGEPFNLGAMTGQVYAITEQSSQDATVNVRCADGNVR